MSARVLLLLTLALASHMAAGQEPDHSQHELGDAPAAAIDAPDDSSVREHVAPDPPRNAMHEMPYGEMTRLMDMDDRAASNRVVFDEAGWRGGEPSDAVAWDAWGWYGTDYDKLWLKSEGHHTSTETDSRLELLFDHIIARWWSLQTGLRHDSGSGPSREWLALGVQGLAPAFLQVEATAYLGEDSRAALRFKTEYELLLTQRLVLQPLLELSAYSKDDAARSIGSGLSSGEIGFRLRYEIRREFAPYLGLFFVRSFGNTADFVQQDGGDSSQWQLAAGLRFWF